MKRLLSILFFGGAVIFIGCNMGIWEKWMLSPPKHIKVNCLGSFITLSPDDKKIIFELTVKKDSITFYHDSNSRHHPYIFQLCSYDIATDSTTILLSSDSIFPEELQYSFDGSKILYTAYYKNKKNINIYEINSKVNRAVLLSIGIIWNAILSPDNKVIYFTAPLGKDFVPKEPHFYFEALYSINTDGSGMKRMGISNPALIVGLSTDKTGENLYFNFMSDSISGPMRLNIETNKLFSLMPKNLTEIRERLICPGNFLPKWFIPIPSNVGDFDYLWAPTTIYKYYEKTGKAEVFYQESKEEQNKHHRLSSNPIAYHTFDKLIMIKDTIPAQIKKRTLIYGMGSLMILNDNGQIERSFLPKHVKDLQAKMDTAKY